MLYSLRIRCFGCPIQRLLAMKISLMLFAVLYSVAALSAAPAQTLHFDDVTEAVGLGKMHGYHAAWGDFDNDGWVDLHEYKNVWRNDRGQFTLIAELKGTGIWGDYNNDGFLDLICAKDDQLYRCGLGKHFIEANPNKPVLSSGRRYAAVWGDFDADGFLDFYVTGSEERNVTIFFPDILVRNLGRGSFEHVWTTPIKRSARGVTAADFDEDGDLDIYVSQFRRERNLLWQNNGYAGFRDVAKAFNATAKHSHSLGAAFGDMDSDGHLDLVVGNMGQPGPVFLQNGGPYDQWHFTDKSAKAGITYVSSHGAPGLGDFDNDGFLDLFLPARKKKEASALYRNNGDWSFTDVTEKTGLADLRGSRQGNWADFDNDGDLDLIADGKLFRNSGNDNAWVKIKLVGTESNRAAIGAQARIKLGERRFTRQVEGGTGESNQNDLTLHFGLGPPRTKPVEVTITWPGGEIQKATVDVNTTTIIEEK